MAKDHVIVTRHQALVALLRERGLIGEDAVVIEHASPDAIRGKDVIGVLPLSLAAIANSITEIPLALSPEDRGRELTLDRIREISGQPVTYKVTRV